MDSAKLVRLLVFSCSIWLVAAGTGGARISSTSEFDDFIDVTGQFLPVQYALILASAGVQPAVALVLANAAPPSALWADTGARHATLSPAVVGNLVYPLLQDDPNAAVEVALVSPYGTATYGFGAARGAGSDAPNSDSLFQIGSITKTFTGALLAESVLEGRIDLNVPAQRYMPSGISLPAYGSQQITMANLATHTGGLPRDVSNGGTASDLLFTIEFNPTQEQYAATVNSAVLLRAPGTSVEYSNVDSSLVGQALQTVYGQSYEALLQQRVLEPLGMTATTSLPVSSQDPRFVTPWYAPGAAVAGTFTDPAGSPISPAGSIVSSGRDMIQYMLACLGRADDPLLHAAISLAETPRIAANDQHDVIPYSLSMAQQDQYPFSLGLFWDTTPSEGEQFLNHTGTVTGTVSGITLNRSQGTGVFITYNHTYLSDMTPSADLVSTASDTILAMQTQLSRYQEHLFAPLR